MKTTWERQPKADVNFEIVVNITGWEGIWAEEMYQQTAEEALDDDLSCDESMEAYWEKREYLRWWIESKGRPVKIDYAKDIVIFADGNQVARVDLREAGVDEVALMGGRHYYSAREYEDHYSAREYDDLDYDARDRDFDFDISYNEDFESVRAVRDVALNGKLIYADYEDDGCFDGCFDGLDRVKGAFEDLCGTENEYFEMGLEVKWHKMLNSLKLESMGPKNLSKRKEGEGHRGNKVRRHLRRLLRTLVGQDYNLIYSELVERCSADERTHLDGGRKYVSPLVTRNVEMVDGKPCKPLYTGRAYLGGRTVAEWRKRQVSGIWEDFYVDEDGKLQETPAGEKYVYPVAAMTQVVFNSKRQWQFIDGAWWEFTLVKSEQTVAKYTRKSDVTFGWQGQKPTYSAKERRQLCFTGDIWEDFVLKEFVVTTNQHEFKTEHKLPEGMNVVTRRQLSAKDVARHFTPGVLKPRFRRELPRWKKLRHVLTRGKDGGHEPRTVEGPVLIDVGSFLPAYNCFFGGF